MHVIENSNWWGETAHREKERTGNARGGGGDSDRMLLNWLVKKEKRRRTRQKKQTGAWR